jgi:hypothetical protein
MAKALNKRLQYAKDKDGRAYDDDTPNSCEFGLELNDPAYYFSIKAPEGTPKFKPRDRQLWVRGENDDNDGFLAAQEETPQVTAMAAIPPGEKLAVRSALPAKKSTPQTPPKKVSSEKPAPTSKPLTPKAVPKPAPKAASKPAPKPNPTPPPAKVPVPVAPQVRPRPQPAPPQFQSLVVPAAVGGGASLKTQFSLTIFADYKGPPPIPRTSPDGFSVNDFLPTGNIYYYDLIFSIRKKPAMSKSDFQLLKIVIDLPVKDPTATTPTSAADEPLLMPEYSGPGLRMLSNQRFIPFLFHDTKNAPMHIELIPRSANDDYALICNDRRTAELGFRLAEPRICPMVTPTFVKVEGTRNKVPRGLVKVRWTEYYKTPNKPEGEPVGDSYDVVKLDGTDDKDMGDLGI